MKQTISRRAFAFFAISALLCTLLILPLAAEGPISGTPSPSLSVWDALSSVFAVRGLSDVIAIFEGARLGFLLIFGVCSLLFALWGYHLSRALFIGGSFVAGWMLGSLIYDPIVSLGLLGENPFFLIRYLVYIALGAVVLVLAKRILRAGVFSAAAISAYLFLSGFAPFELLVDAVIPADFAFKYLVGRLLIALAVGALSLSLTKPVIIVTTALAGGTLAAVALCVALGIGYMSGVVTIIGLVFSGAGVLSQFRVGHHRKSKKRALHKEDLKEEEAEETEEETTSEEEAV